MPCSPSPSPRPALHRSLPKPATGSAASSGTNAITAVPAVMIAIARTGGRPHFVFGVFPVDYAGALDRHLRTGGSLRVADWLDDIGFTPVDFDDPGASAVDPFFNVNAPEDLTTAQALLTQFGQG